MTPSLARHILIFAALAFTGLSSARAHELEATVRLAAPAAIVRATYGGSEPVPFAKVQVFSPGTPTSEFQTGFTDRAGNFSFVPDRSGPWRVVLDDDEGHRRDVRVDVPDPFDSAATSAPAPVSRLERALLGVAVILAATGFLYGFTSRRSNRPSS